MQRKNNSVLIKLTDFYVHDLVPRFPDMKSSEGGVCIVIILRKAH